VANAFLSVAVAVVLVGVAGVVVVTGFVEEGTVVVGVVTEGVVREGATVLGIISVVVDGLVEGVVGCAVAEGVVVVEVV
jgi:hypothetical protein